MMGFRISRRSTVWLTIGLVTLAVAGLAVPGASAQDMAVPDVKPARPIKLDGVCAVSLARFCPDLAATPGQLRNQVICLKPYRSSLPLSCRSAVNAAMR